MNKKLFITKANYNKILYIEMSSVIGLEHNNSDVKDSEHINIFTTNPRALTISDKPEINRFIKEYTEYVEEAALNVYCKTI